MIDDEFIKKFDSIEDLPISEEMLGAYLEGNLTESEISGIELMIQYQPNVCELYEDVTQSIDFPHVSHDIFESIDFINVAPIDTNTNNFDFDESELSSLFNDFELPSLEGPTTFGDSFNNNVLGIDINFNPDNDFNLNL